MAWRSSHNMSRLRMLELFSRVTGSGGGTGEAALFNGLRVRMVGGAAVPQYRKGQSGEALM
jgi:hypothetical protein